MCAASVSVARDNGPLCYRRLARIQVEVYGHIGHQLSRISATQAQLCHYATSVLAHARLLDPCLGDWDGCDDRTGQQTRTPHWTTHWTSHRPLEPLPSALFWIRHLSLGSLPSASFWSLQRLARVFFGVSFKKFPSPQVRGRIQTRE